MSIFVGKGLGLELSAVCVVREQLYICFHFNKFWTAITNNLLSQTARICWGFWSFISEQIKHQENLFCEASAASPLEPRPVQPRCETSLLSIQNGANSEGTRNTSVIPLSREIGHLSCHYGCCQTDKKMPVEGRSCMKTLEVEGKVEIAGNVDKCLRFWFYSSQARAYIPPMLVSAIVGKWTVTYIVYIYMSAWLTLPLWKLLCELLGGCVEGWWWIPPCRLPLEYVLLSKISALWRTKAKPKLHWSEKIGRNIQDIK